MFAIIIMMIVITTFVYEVLFPCRSMFKGALDRHDPLKALVFIHTRGDMNIDLGVVGI